VIGAFQTDTPQMRKLRRISFECRLLPSSQAALRPPGPLRTGREGFPSPSSSPSNASLEQTRFRNEKTLTMNPVMALGMK
jgi:hypothetical protein